MTGIAPYTATSVGVDSISATEQNGSRQVRGPMTSIDPYSYTRGADSISATEQNDSRQARGPMTGIDPYSNPP